MTSRPWLALLAMGACEATTGGARVDVPIEARATGPLTFTDEETGWTWQIDEASVALGPLYLWSGAPLVSSAARAVDFDFGFLRGELVTQTAVDLTGEPVDLGVASVLAGDVGSAELWLAPPLPTTGLDATIAVSGVARRADVELPFALDLTIDGDVIDPASGETALERQKVRGIPVVDTLDAGDALTLGVEPARWFTGIDLDPADAPPEGPLRPAPGDAAFTRFLFQARQSGPNGPWRITRGD